MAFDRSDRTSIGLAVAGHIVLLGALSVQFYGGPPPRFDNPPMDVDLIAETALVSAAPELSETPPAAALGDPDSLDMDAAQPSDPVAQRPSPAPRPASPVPIPARPDKPTATKPAKKSAPSPTGRLDGILSGISKDESKSASTASPAQSVGEIKRSIDVSIDREIKPHWQRTAPTGFDVDQLATTIEFRLNRDGSLSGTPRLVGQSGKTDSNEPQQQRHVEGAIKAIVLAAPFDLPEEYYDQWKVWRFTFRTRTR